MQHSMKLFRALRVLKLVTRNRRFKVIIRTVFSALQSLIFILVLLVLLMYFFAIFAIGIFESYSKDTTNMYHDKFKTFGRSFETLFQLFTLDQWYAINEDISTQSPPGVATWSHIFFVLYIFIGSFIFRNVFVGVMVRYFQDIDKDIKRLEDEHSKKERIRVSVQRLGDVRCINGIKLILLFPCTFTFLDS